MAFSMTGYGMGVAEDKVRVTVEIKTVNHRYLDFIIRVPRGFMSFEDVVRQEVSQRLHRGRAEIVVTVEDFADTNRTVTIDWGLVKGYEAALKELEKTLGIHYQARGEHILQQPDVLIPESVAPKMWNRRCGKRCIGLWITCWRCGPGRVKLWPRISCNGLPNWKP